VRHLLIGLALIAGPVAAGAQDAGLAAEAERARRAWLAHDAGALVARSPRLLIQLPGAEPAVAVGPAQAAALLADFLGGSQEIEVRVRAARQVQADRGYVELQRRYRVAGTQQARSQTVLLGYRRGREWVLVELRVIG
jgi:hypothetical protein